MQIAHLCFHGHHFAGFTLHQHIAREHQIIIGIAQVNILQRDVLWPNGERRSHLYNTIERTEFRKNKSHIIGGHFGLPQPTGESQRLPKSARGIQVVCGLQGFLLKMSSVRHRQFETAHRKSLAVTGQTQGHSVDGQTALLRHLETSHTQIETVRSQPLQTHVNIQPLHMQMTQIEGTGSGRPKMLVVGHITSAQHHRIDAQIERRGLLIVFFFESINDKLEIGSRLRRSFIEIYLSIQHGHHAQRHFAMKQRQNFNLGGEQTGIKQGFSATVVDFHISQRNTIEKPHLHPFHINRSMQLLLQCRSCRPPQPSLHGRHV